jgi:hypothetical protein
MDTYGRTPTRPCSVPLSHRAKRPKLGTRRRPLPRTRSGMSLRSTLHPYRDRRNTNLKSCRPGRRLFFFWSRLLYAHKYGLLIFSLFLTFLSGVVSLSAGSRGLASSAVAYTYILSSVITRLDVQASTNSHVRSLQIFNCFTLLLRTRIHPLILITWIAHTCTAARRRTAGIAMH